MALVATPVPKILVKHQVRIGILSLLRNQEALSVGELNSHFPNMVGPHFSVHVKALREAKAIRCRRDGQKIMVSITAIGRKKLMVVG
jgi:DNA-binding transcriptional ArsR family regulator